MEGVGEKGADGAPGLSNIWGKKHDGRGLEVAIDICEKSESTKLDDERKRRREGDVWGLTVGRSGSQRLIRTWDF